MTKSKPAETKPEAEPKEDGMIRITLRTPILINGEPSNQLVLREPTGRDIELNGLPVMLDFSKDPTGVVFDEKKMVAMIAGLGGIPPSSIRSMHPKDWATVAWQLASFFVPDLGT